MTPQERARRVLAEGGQILLPFLPDEPDIQVTFTRTRLMTLIELEIRRALDEAPKQATPRTRPTSWPKLDANGKPYGGRFAGE